MKLRLLLAFLSTFLLWNCKSKDPATDNCGDGLIDSGEQCDGGTTDQLTPGFVVFGQ